MKFPDDFILTRKLREEDVLLTDEGYLNIGQLINERPMFLWYILHTRNRGVTLVRPTYDRLKSIIKEIEPNKVLEVEKFASNYKARCKFARGEGNFKSVGKRLKINDISLRASRK